jgi:hypothetical protein
MCIFTVLRLIHSYYLVFRYRRFTCGSHFPILAAPSLSNASHQAPSPPTQKMTALLVLQILKCIPVLWIRILSDRHHFVGSGSISTKCNSRNFNTLFKMMKIMTPMTLMRMTKHCKLALISIKVKKDYGFPISVKLGGRIRIWIWIVIIFERISFFLLFYSQKISL